jgi:L,D-transpeptidase-like protein
MLKNNNSNLVLLCLIAATEIAFSWPTSSSWSAPTINTYPIGTSSWVRKELTILQNQASNINIKALRVGLEAYLRARKEGLDKRQLLTVIDFSKPSTERRLWVFDLKNNKTLFNTWVSHGKNSGGTTPTSFSNQVGSLKSSIGVFLTDEPYIGHNGYSLRLKGLEPGINDNAYRRNVVIHGARYVGADTLNKYGQIGRSWGCPAVDKRTSRPLIDTIKENTLLVAYYPDPKWLSHSQFLTG